MSWKNRLQEYLHARGAATLPIYVSAPIADGSWQTSCTIDDRSYIGVHARKTDSQQVAAQVAMQAILGRYPETPPPAPAPAPAPARSLAHMVSAAREQLAELTILLAEIEARL